MTGGRGRATPTLPGDAGCRGPTCNVHPHGRAAVTSNSSRRVRSAAARSQAQAPAPTTGADSMWTVQRSDGTVATGWVLMPLRLFLGATFLFAGLQKLANPNFLRSSSPASIHAQLAGAIPSRWESSPWTGLERAAPAVGLVIALGEVAIGIAVV